MWGGGYESLIMLFWCGFFHGIGGFALDLTGLRGLLQVYETYQLNSEGVDTLKANLSEAETVGGFFGAVLGNFNDGLRIATDEPGNGNRFTGATGFLRTFGAHEPSSLTVVLGAAVDALLPSLTSSVAPEQQQPVSLFQQSSDEIESTQQLAEGPHQDTGLKREPLQLSVIFAIHSNTSVAVIVEKLRAIKDHYLQSGKGQHSVSFMQHHGLADTTSTALCAAGWIVGKAWPLGTLESRTGYIRHLLQERPGLLQHNPDIGPAWIGGTKVGLENLGRGNGVSP